MKYHINGAGTPSPCTASTRGCPYGSQDEHYKTLEEAQFMADIKHELSTDFRAALNNHPVETIPSENLRAYQKYVLEAMNGNQPQVKYEDNEEVRETVRRMLQEEFTDFRREVEEAKKSFNTTQDWQTGLPEGLFKGINPQLKLSLANEVLVNSDGVFDAHLQSRLQMRERVDKLKNSPQWRNFNALVDDNFKTLYKNTQEYKFTQMTEEDIQKRENHLIEQEYNLRVATVPQDKLEKFKEKANTTERKEVLTRINKEIMLRRELSKFEVTNFEDRISSKTNNLELTNISLNESGEIDNLYLVTDDNKFYKVKGYSEHTGEFNVSTSNGVSTYLTTRKNVKPANLRQGKFSFVRTSPTSSNISEIKFDIDK